jgi:hypothetical protein
VSVKNEATETRWSNRFIEALEAARLDEEGQRAMEELRTLVSVTRTQKAPPVFAKIDRVS